MCDSYDLWYKQILEQFDATKFLCALQFERFSLVVGRVYQTLHFQKYNTPTTNEGGMARRARRRRGGHNQYRARPRIIVEENDDAELYEVDRVSGIRRENGEVRFY